MTESSLRMRVRRTLSRLIGGKPPAPDQHAVELKALRRLVEQILHRVERLDKAGKEREGALAEVRTQLKGLRIRLDTVATNQKAARKVRSGVSKQVTSLVRAQYLPAHVPAAGSLRARRFRLYSQNEEDGIILALLEASGVTGRRFLELGSGSSGGNSYVVAFEMGWTGLMVEARAESARRLRLKLAHNPHVAVVAAFVTPENVNDLVRSHGLGGEIDLFSLDIDSTDYWVFEALEACTPRVVVIEYNAMFGPDRAVTIPNAPRPDGAPGVYVGASLSALEKLARRKGYGLVHCEDSGINAFFLRDGLAPEVPRLTAAAAYRPRRVGDAVSLREPGDALDEIERAGLPLVEV